MAWTDRVGELNPSRLLRKPRALPLHHRCSLQNFVNPIKVFTEFCRSHTFVFTEFCQSHSNFYRILSIPFMSLQCFVNPIQVFTEFCQSHSSLYEVLSTPFKSLQNLVNPVLFFTEFCQSHSSLYRILSTRYPIQVFTAFCQSNSSLCRFQVYVWYIKIKSSHAIRGQKYEEMPLLTWIPPPPFCLPS